MRHLTRRQFLSDAMRCTAGTAAAAGWAAAQSPSGTPSPAGELLADLPPVASRPSTRPIDPGLLSRVAHLQEPQSIDGLKVHRVLVREMIELGLALSTNLRDPGEAWNSLLARDEVIAVKCNHVGADALNTTVPFLQSLTDSLKAADIAPDRLILLEAPDVAQIRELKTRPVPHGFRGPEHDFGSGAEQLAAVLDEATAIINVPFLKTHNIAGMTGCLKNLSHALVRRPGRYHANACAPYVGDILALPPIREKLRVHIVNALRVVIDGGPWAEKGTFLQHGGVLVGTDPVALDAFGLDVLNAYRTKAGLEPIARSGADIPSILSAARRGLGTVDQDYYRVLTREDY